ncbi:MAG: aminoglycoside phosphotransferase family protein [Chitinophagaceae bacterium]|nr:aminoglycoside phosphotransferase family protein [Chitinophagaceae bacterium]
MQEIFSLYGWQVDSYAPIQQGLINSTYSIQTNKGAYILQCINHSVFKSPTAIDENINAISKYLLKNHPQYLFTHLVPTLNGNTLVQWEGAYYRAFHKIEGYALSVLDNENQVEQAAMQFAGFTSILKNFEASQLKDSLPDFHNLNLRYHQFSEAIIKGNAQRIAETKEAISFLAAHKNYVDIYSAFIHHAEVKKRVTHHDTKISNVLFQKNNGIEKAICVIDLDTVMGGYFISDIGDMCRTCLCAVSEEEKDLNKVVVDAAKWKALEKGYLYFMQDELSSFERDHFFYGGQFMIYMQALRFLTDHLNNDLYYGAKYEGQNLVRTLNQIRLLEQYNKLN